MNQPNNKSTELYYFVLRSLSLFIDPFPFRVKPDTNDGENIWRPTPPRA